MWSLSSAHCAAEGSEVRSASQPTMQEATSAVSMKSLRNRTLENETDMSPPPKANALEQGRGHGSELNEASRYRQLPRITESR
jgi:hypothetical protein